MKNYVTANYTTMDLYLRQLPFEPYTDYVIELDVLGGEMELWFSGKGILHLPAATHWTHCSFSVKTEKEVATLVNEGLSFVKTAWPYHAFGGIYETTYVKNMRIYNRRTERDLLGGFGTKQWHTVLKGGGSTFGVKLITDPLNPTERCVRFPHVINTVSYPQSFPLQVVHYGRFTELPNDVHGLEFIGRPHYRFILVQRGRISLSVGDKHYTVTDGGVFCLPPHTPYHYVYHAGDDTRYYWISACGEQLSSLLSVPAPDVPEPFTLPNPSVFTAIIDRMIASSPELTTHGYAASGHLQLLLNEWEHQRFPSNAPTKHIAAIQAIANRLYHHPELPHSTASLAAECGLSEHYFLSLFKQLTHTTPQQLRRRGLMEHSRQLLIQSDMSIQEIAFALGLEDPLYFSRQFRSAHGVSPTQYRKEHKKG